MSGIPKKTIYDAADLARYGAEFAEWRKTRLPSSDAAIITGDASYSSPMKLWNLKTGRGTTAAAAADSSRDDIERSAKLKPIMREIIEEMRGIKLTRCLMTHSEKEFIYSHYDGFNTATGEFWHLKTPRVRTHDAINYYGEIAAAPRYRTELLQQQMIAESRFGGKVRGFFASYISDTAKNDYYGESGGEGEDTPNLIILPFEFQPTRIAKLLEVECAFWEFVSEQRKPTGFPKQSSRILGKDWRRG